MNRYGELLNQKIEKARDNVSYRIYLDTREIILAMLNESKDIKTSVSQYWREELAGFEYLFDASPLIIQKLREHSYHITGLYSYTYRRHHSHRSSPFRRKFRQLQLVDRKNLFIEESKALGGFGFDIDGSLINLDTLKFYESLIAMDLGGVLDLFEQKRVQNPVVLEIGAGWGGFAYQFKTLFPNTSYIIIDLPQTLLFSIIYLKTLFPERRFFIFGEDGTSQLPADVRSYDFIFLPPYAMNLLTSTMQIDLGINMVSFQEMTRRQVDIYASSLAKINCPMIYSHNRNINPHNSELQTLSDILEQYYLLEEIQVLGVPYTQLEKTTQRKAGFQVKAKNWVTKLFEGRKTSEIPSPGYRHLVGKLAPKIVKKSRQPINKGKGMEP